MLSSLFRYLAPSQMAWWKKLFGGTDDSEQPDYYEEGAALLDDGQYHEALTSFRLALKESPGDPVVLQQIAVSYTRIGMTEEAAKTYRHVLQKDPSASGAHYGLAFLLVRSGKPREAVSHLQAFLADPPAGPEAEEHVAHARSTLEDLTGSPPESGASGRRGGRGSASPNDAP